MKRKEVSMARALAVLGLGAVAASGSAALAQNAMQSMSGIGYAEVTADVAAVKAAAEADARRGLVRAMLEDAIGAERAAQIASATIQSLADQIQPTMIMSQSGQREGTRYKWTIQANVDRAWFTTQIRVKGIETTAQRGGAAGRLIFVMLDHNSGVGRNYNKPQEVITEYDSSKGSSYSDKSISAYSDKEKAAASYSSKSAASARSSAAAGYSNYYGSGAARRSSSASAASNASAYSSMPACDV